MAARKVNTPGAPEKAPEPVSTAEQADAALEHITGQDESQDQSTNETSSLGALVDGGQTPTEEDLQAKKEYEEFLEWRKNKGIAATTQPATPLASGSANDPAPKRTRQVVGKHGWTTEEF